MKKKTSKKCIKIKASRTYEYGCLYFKIKMSQVQHQPSQFLLKFHAFFSHNTKALLCMMLLELQCHKCHKCDLFQQYAPQTTLDFHLDTS